MRAEAATAQGAAPQPVRAGRLAGLVLEVADLPATRAFYEPIFREAPGVWSEAASRLTFQTPEEKITFVLRRRPRTFADGGHHQAYRVPRQRLQGLVDELTARRHPVDWWREDHPSERRVSPYFRDPSGNRVQLVATEHDSDERLLDHAAIEVYEFDYCEYLYVTTLGGEVDYYHGWRTADQEDAKLWGEGDDPCAPWTRRDNPHYRDFLVEDPTTGELRPARFAGELGVSAPGRHVRVPRPNGQVFISYGPTRLVLTSATRVRQEPPEEQVRGTPRLIFACDQRAPEVESHLATTVNPHLRDGRRIYVRDADGNFAELVCQ